MNIYIAEVYDLFDMESTFIKIESDKTLEEVLDFVTNLKEEHFIDSIVTVYPLEDYLKSLTTIKY